jgi:hypothetical protein
MGEEIIGTNISMEGQSFYTGAPTETVYEAIKDLIRGTNFGSLDATNFIAVVGAVASACSDTFAVIPAAHPIDTSSTIVVTRYDSGSVGAYVVDPTPVDLRTDFERGRDAGIDALLDYAKHENKERSDGTSRVSIVNLNAVGSILKAERGRKGDVNVKTVWPYHCGVPLGGVQDA